MKHGLVVLATAAVSAAHNVYRQVAFNSSSTVHSTGASVSSTSHSPASIASAGTATVTNSANGTRTSTSATTSPPSLSTCCYLWPGVVGVNSWWSSSINLTIATVITTWIKYNDTIVPGKSTTISVVNATSIYGSLGGGLYPTYTEVGPPTLTTTVSECAYDPVHDPCTQSTTEVVTIRSHSTYAYQLTTVSGVPGGLLPIAADMLYGSTLIENATAATYPLQSLTIQSPTPFFRFRGIGLYTSMECVKPVVLTSTSVYVRTTIDGTLVTTRSFYPTYTSTPLPDGVYFEGGNVLADNATVARPFPDGDYSNWNFSAWMDGIVTGPQAGTVDAYTFELDDDLAGFFAGIPFVSEQFTDVDIATCQPLLGGGEPSVHVPVNQLIDTAHVTVTRAGTLPKPTTPKTTSAEPTQDPMDGTTANEPQPEPTTSPDPQPAETSNEPQPQPTTSPSAEPTGGAPPNSPSQQPTAEPVQNGGEPDTPNNTNTPHVPNNANTPDIISIIQQVTNTPAGQNQNTAPAAEPTSNGVGDIIASVIGMVPGGNSNEQQGSSANTGSQSDSQPQGEQAASPPVITVGNSVVTANSPTEFVVGGQTLAPGGSAITAGGTAFAIAFGGSAIVVNGVTTPINVPDVQAAVQTPAAQITVGESLVRANDNGNFVVGSQTLAAGGSAITVDGSTYSLAPSGTALVVNGQTSAIAVPFESPVTIDGEIATPIASGAYILPGGEILSPGGSGVTIDGTTYSLAPSRSVVVDGVTSPLLSAAGVITGLPAASQNSLMELVLDGTTLLPGSSAVVSGTTYSLPATGGGLYINGQSSALPGSVFTLPNGVVATPTVVSDLVIGSQTLVPGGPAITVSGTTYSLSGTGVIVAAPATTYTEDIEEFESSATARQTSSGRMSSPTITSTDSTGSAGSSSSTSPTSTSGASKSLDLMGAMCVAICSVALVMSLM